MGGNFKKKREKERSIIRNSERLKKTNPKGKKKISQNLTKCRQK